MTKVTPIYVFLCSLLHCLRLSAPFALRPKPATSIACPTTTYPHQTQRSKSCQLHNIQNDDNEDPEIAMERNIQRTCVKQFLTQRSIQSFMFLAEQVRDPHTGDWVERFLETSDLLNFHGTGAINFTRFPVWSTFFMELMHQPKATITIQAKRRGRGHGGWSKNNPYLKVRYVEFEVQIDPESIVNRIMSVREQIGNEFAQDMDLVRQANDQILDSYDESLTGGTSTKAFDRNAYTTLINNLSMDTSSSSPFRKGSFDLLQLLSLQEAIHLVLREYMSMGEKKEVSFQFLREFYVERVANYFDGYVNYGRADDFLEELLLTTPSVRTSNQHMELIDPLSIANDIIDMRSKILINWKVEMENVPQDHMELRKMLLTKQMGNWLAEDNASQAVTFDEEGAFE